MATKGLTIFFTSWVAPACLHVRHGPDGHNLLVALGVIEVGVSPAGKELHRIVSSNPGAEKMNVTLTGSNLSRYSLG